MEGLVSSVAPSFHLKIGHVGQASNINIDQTTVGALFIPHHDSRQSDQRDQHRKALFTLLSFSTWLEYALSMVGHPGPRPLPRAATGGQTFTTWVNGHSTKSVGKGANPTLHFPKF